LLIGCENLPDGSCSVFCIAAAALKPTARSNAAFVSYMDQARAT